MSDSLGISVTFTEDIFIFVLAVQTSISFPTCKCQYMSSTDIIHQKSINMKDWADFSPWSSKNLLYIHKKKKTLYEGKPKILKEQFFIHIQIRCISLRKKKLINEWEMCGNK